MLSTDSKFGQIAPNECAYNLNIVIAHISIKSDNCNFGFETCMKNVYLIPQQAGQQEWKMVFLTIAGAITALLFLGNIPGKFYL